MNLAERDRAAPRGPGEWRAFVAAVLAEQGPRIFVALRSASTPHDLERVRRLAGRLLVVASRGEEEVPVDLAARLERLGAACQAFAASLAALTPDERATLDAGRRN